MTIVLAILAVLLGGILKGAIGAGAPIIAAPAITMLYDVQTAVAVLVLPNIFSNIWQAWAFRKEAMPLRFQIQFAGGGVVGVVAGTLLLAWLPPDVLSLMVALAVIFYIALRLSKPDWVLGREAGERLAAPAGLTGGILQGATGLSAPASLTFLSAMRLPRGTFIGTISMFFITMSMAQVPALVGVGILTTERMLAGVVVLGLVFAGMPIGAWLGRKLSARVFDVILLSVLGAIAAKIIIEALF